MNGVKELYGVKLKQTSKGIWYCDGLTVEVEHPDLLPTQADELMTAIEIALKDHNKETE